MLILRQCNLFRNLEKKRIIIVFAFSGRIHTSFVAVNTSIQFHIATDYSRLQKKSSVRENHFICINIYKLANRRSTIVLNLSNGFQHRIALYLQNVHSEVQVPV